MEMLFYALLINCFSCQHISLYLVFSLLKVHKWLNELKVLPHSLLSLIQSKIKVILFAATRGQMIYVCIFFFQRVSWTVAALVMVINAYLLLDFFISEVNGVLFGSLVCIGTGAYITFIIYLVTRDGVLSSTLYSLISAKSSVCSGN